MKVAQTSVMRVQSSSCWYLRVGGGGDGVVRFLMRLVIEIL